MASSKVREAGPAAVVLPAQMYSDHARVERKSNFYLGFLFLSKPRRRALNLVYGFCRMMDDIVDSGNLKPEEAKKMLDFWRAEIERTYQGCPTHSLTGQLAECIQEFNLPKKPFLDLISGVEMDLSKNRYESFQELEEYLYGVAVTVGLLCVEIFGYKYTSKEQIREYAKNMGQAFQLTNIIRDVGSDIEIGRVYLPQELMRRHGYSMDDLIHRRHTEALNRVLNDLRERAKLCYRRARNCLDPRDRPSMIPAEIMAHVYEDLLDHLSRHLYPVLFERARLSPFQKMMSVGRALAYSYGVH